MLRRLLLSSVLAASLVVYVAPLAVAQTAAPDASASRTGSLTGTITDQRQHELGGVNVAVSGQTSRTTVTDSAGTFQIDGLPPGLYTITITKPGFNPSRDDEVIIAGSVTNVKPELAPVSLSTLKTIGSVTTTRSANALNTSTAAVSSVDGQTFIDQGQHGVSNVLNEIPGVSIGFSSGTGSSGYGGGAGASPLNAGYPSLRGSLSYETASLIDGHPIALGLTGSFDPSFISPYVLEDVEIVKGPGAQAPNINYAIGGTFNYRTLQPTRTPKQSIDFGVDQFGGFYGNARATGTFGRLGYAFDYATTGTQGFNRNYSPLDPNVLLAPGDLVNGQPVCGNPNATVCGIGVIVPPSSPYFQFVTFTSPLALCCDQVQLGANTRNELAKLHYAFNDSTSLTVSYLGAQQRGVPGLYTLPDYIFTPPAGYTGSLPAGAAFPQDEEYNTIYYVNTNLFSAEFATALGPVSFNARYYVASDYSFLDANPVPSSFTGLLYGGVALNNDLNPTIFNGQTGTVTYLHGQFGDIDTNHLGGLTLQAALPVGRNYYSVSYDQNGDSSSAIQHFPPFNPQVPPGSSQVFRTIALHGQFELAPRFQATLSDYQLYYTDHYTQDFGATFTDSTHAYNAPRLALSWRPASDLAVRAAAGYSIAPPYARLLTNSAPVGGGTGGGAAGSYFTVTNNSGDVRPETAFGFDFGADKRLRGDIVASLDLYQTTLHDQYLTLTQLSPTPFINPPPGLFLEPPGTYPLYITKTANLGHARYEGIEFALHRDPVEGFGFKLQGSLQKAYPYDLPPGFYNTPTGPNTTNLSIWPGVNYYGSGGPFTSGLAAANIPYSQGYAELNFRHKNTFGLIGLTYYGPNNGYDQPAFGVVNASLRQQFTKALSLTLAATNITSAYSDYTFNDLGGVPTPLVNGSLAQSAGTTVGPSTASLTLRVDF
jgi:outer membrane receptor protein involved in Fe transport